MPRKQDSHPSGLVDSSKLKPALWWARKTEKKYGKTKRQGSKLPPPGGLPGVNQTAHDRLHGIKTLVYSFADITDNAALQTPFYPPTSIKLLWAYFGAYSAGTVDLQYEIFVGLVSSRTALLGTLPGGSDRSKRESINTVVAANEPITIWIDNIGVHDLTGPATVVIGYED